MSGMQRRMPLGLIGTLILVAGIEGEFGRRGDNLAAYQGLGARFAARRAVSDAPGRAVLGIGDSVMKFGFDPATVERTLNVGAYNLAVPGTPPPLADALLARALRAGARPQAVVVGYMTLSGDPWVSLPDLAEVLDVGESLRLAWLCRNASLFSALSLAHWVPSIRYRHALRHRVVSQLQGQMPSGAAGGEASASLRAWASGLGAELRAPGGSYDGKIEPHLEDRLINAQWHVYNVYEKAFRKMVTRAVAAGARVYWLIPPIVPDAQARRDALGLDARHSTNIRALQARLPKQVVVLDGRRLGLAGTDFFDTCHLNARGAARLTAAVARAIHAPNHADADRWVVLQPDDQPASQVANQVGAIPRR